MLKFFQGPFQHPPSIYYFNIVINTDICFAECSFDYIVVTFLVVTLSFWIFAQYYSWDRVSMESH